LSSLGKGPVEFLNKSSDFYLGDSKLRELADSFIESYGRELITYGDSLVVAMYYWLLIVTICLKWRQLSKTSIWFESLIGAEEDVY